MKDREEYISILEQDNAELKKQLEVKKIIARNWEVDCKRNISKVEEKETQQKEFINYLENEIQKKREKSATLTAYRRNVVPLQQCLQKYKSIIGDINDKK